MTVINADHLEFQPPGTILEWRIYDDGLIAGDYRIQLLGPRSWRVMCQDEDIGQYGSLKLAFSSAEHHVRERHRRSAMIRFGTFAALAFVAWLAVDAILGLTRNGYVALLLFPIMYLGIGALVRSLVAAVGDVRMPYYPRIRRIPGVRKRVRKRLRR